MDINAIIPTIPNSYPAPQRAVPTASPPPKDVTDSSRRQNITADIANLSLSQHHKTYRQALPLYDQPLSARGQRAQQLYNNVEFNGDSELMNRIDEYV